MIFVIQVQIVVELKNAIFLSHAPDSRPLITNLLLFKIYKSMIMYTKILLHKLSIHFIHSTFYYSWYPRLNPICSHILNISSSHVVLNTSNIHIIWIIHIIHTIHIFHIIHIFHTYSHYFKCSVTTLCWKGWVFSPYPRASLPWDRRPKDRRPIPTTEGRWYGRC